jgi:hypothetical protein
LLAIVEAHFLSVLIGAFVANALGALAVLPCRSAVSRSSEGHLETPEPLCSLEVALKRPSCSAACGVKWPSMPRLLNLKSRPSSSSAHDCSLLGTLVTDIVSLQFHAMQVCWPSKIIRMLLGYVAIVKFMKIYYVISRSKFDRL